MFTTTPLDFTWCRLSHFCFSIRSCLIHRPQISSWTTMTSYDGHPDDYFPINVEVNFQSIRRSFFCKSNCKNIFLRFFKKREQITDSAVALNETRRLCCGIKRNKKRFFLIATSLYGHRVFFHSANSLTFNELFIAIIYRR